jgi:LmbE family N-acetylglucosaminyl deacetylase
MICFKLVLKHEGMRSYFYLLIFLPFVSFSQPSQPSVSYGMEGQPDAALILLKLKKLNFLGSVLYMAAHPDDENTNIIAYLSNDKLATTGYLSLTRGDGGQNLIGPEIRELLGLIRTQELLAARRIDGGQQFFTRAIDFGFSKSADEAFEIWGKKAVLSDAIKVIRQFQPDIIITRFPPDERAGHGHHTASAIVAAEAFELAGKSDVFPEQVKQYGTWQVKRLFTNTGRWWNRSINEDTPGIITIDVGGYNAVLGKSYSEISALSSSQHKSQGWGRRGERGYRPEFLEPVKGEQAKKNIFDGVDTTWNRVTGGSKIQSLVSRAAAEFNPTDPAASVPLLFQIKKEIARLNDSVWKDRKLREVERLIVDCLGLFIEVTASHYQGSAGYPMSASVELINRAKNNLTLTDMNVEGLQWDSVFSAPLERNKPMNINLRAQVNTDAKFSDPYWLQSPHSTGLYTVDDKSKIGMPQDSPPVIFSFDIRVNDDVLTVYRPMVYKWVDAVKGELWRPFEIVPPVTVNLSEHVLVFSTRDPKDVTLLLRSSGEENLTGVLQLKLPSGWRADPASVPFELHGRGDEQIKKMTVYPSSGELSGIMKAVVTVNEKQFDRSMVTVSYDHFPIQTLLPPAEAKAVRIDLKKAGERIGYVEGAGDEIPSALRNMGYSVWEMKNDEISKGNLSGLDALVFGVRALNTNERIRYFMPVVLDYVKEGGTVVVQYNTNSRMQTDNFSPFPLTVGRDRVTDESSEVRILKPAHPVLNTPNKVHLSDFEGWVQERGLYFPSEWDPNFEAILSMNDKGETPKNSSLLVAKYGKGYYIYTSLSFFRELPEGVPGAYKLFANLVSLGKNSRAEVSRTKERSK